MNITRQRQNKKNWVSLLTVILRSLLALSVVFVYIFDRSALDFNADEKNLSISFFSKPFLVAVWVFLLIDLLVRLFPLPGMSIGMKKSFASGYLPKHPEKPPVKDEQHIAKMQKDALRSFIFYIFFNSLYFIPYLLIKNGVWKPLESAFLPAPLAAYIAGVGAPEMLLGTMLYYLADGVFVRHWCIFKDVINKNRCCADCRISCWDGIMCITPLLLCPLTAFSLPLLLLALISFFRFELSFLRHPERFDPKQNALLSCAYCQNDVCPRKSKIRKL